MTGAILARKQTTCKACRNPILVEEPIVEVEVGHRLAGEWVHEECEPQPGFDDKDFVQRLNAESEARS